MTLSARMTSPPDSAASSCALCALAGGEYGRSPSSQGDLVVAYVDDGVIVFFSTRHDGALIAPRCHVGGMSSLTGDALPKFLAALRRTAIAEETISGGRPTSIEPWDGGAPN